MVCKNNDGDRKKTINTLQQAHNKTISSVAKGAKKLIKWNLYFTDAQKRWCSSKNCLTFRKYYFETTVIKECFNNRMSFLKMFFKACHCLIFWKLINSYMVSFKNLPFDALKVGKNKVKWGKFKVAKFCT